MPITNPWKGTPAEKAYQDISNPTPVQPKPPSSSSGGNRRSGGSSRRNTGGSRNPVQQVYEEVSTPDYVKEAAIEKAAQSDRGRVISDSSDSFDDASLNTFSQGNEVSSFDESSSLSDEEKYERVYSQFQSVEQRLGEFGSRIPGRDPFESVSDRLQRTRESWYSPSEFRTKKALERQGITEDSYSKFDKVTIPETTVGNFEKGDKGSSLVRFEETSFDPDEQSYRELVEFLSQRGEDVGRQQAVYEYQKTGEVPEYFASQVSIPDNIRFLGKDVESAYVSEVFEESMGLNDPVVSKDFVGPVKPSDFELQQTVRGAYEDLPESKKAEYNVRFLDWSGVPVEEWKYYPGGKQYLSGLSENEKQEVIDEYLESAGDISDTVERRQFSLGRALFPENVEDVTFGETSYTPAVEREKTRREMAWEDLTLSQGEKERLYFSESSFPARATLASSMSLVQGLAWPVTLPQTAVKLVNKGNTLFLPDVSKNIEESTATPPSVIGSAIADVWLGQDVSEAKEWHKQFPVESGFGVGAEILGSYLTGKMLGAARMKTREVFPPQYEWTSYSNVNIDDVMRSEFASHYGLKLRMVQQGQRVFLKNTRFQFKSPFSTLTRSKGLDIRAIQFDEPVSYLDDAGRSVYYPKGKTIWSVDKGIIEEKSLFGWRSKVFEGAGNVEPRTIININRGKFGVDIQPVMEEKLLQLGSGKPITSLVKRDAPVASLSLSDAQLADDIFKMGAEGSEFYGGVSSTMFEGGPNAITKSVTQTWELPQELSVMKRPRLENVKLEWFESGKPIQSIGGKKITGAGGFTVTGGKYHQPKVFIEKDLTSKGYMDRLTPKGKLVDTGHTVRHELLHQRFPNFSEAEVTALAYKKLPVERIRFWQDTYRSVRKESPELADIFDKAIETGRYPDVVTDNWGVFDDYKFAKETSQIDISALKKIHRSVFPDVNKAVKGFFSDYSMREGIKYPVLFGSETRLVKPFRQFGKVSGKGFTGEVRGFGYSNVLKEITKPSGERVSVMSFSQAKGSMARSGLMDDLMSVGEMGSKSVVTGEVFASPPFILSMPKPGYLPFMEVGMGSRMFSELFSESQSDVVKRSARTSRSDVMQELFNRSDLVKTSEMSLENVLGLSSDLVNVQSQQSDSLPLFDVVTPIVSTPVTPVIQQPFTFTLGVPFFGGDRRRLERSSRKRRSRRKGYRERVTPVQMYWMG